MAKLHNIIEECRAHVRKIVYAIEPASIGGKGERWHAHNTDSGDILKSGESVRLFDVYPMAQGQEIKDFGSDTFGIEIPMLIVICYGENQNYNQLIQSDYASIVHALHNANIGMVSGLNYYMATGLNTTEEEGKRYAVVSFAAYVSATFDNLSINDPGGYGGSDGYGGL